ERRVLESLEQLDSLDGELSLAYQLHLELGFELAVELAAVRAPHIGDLHLGTVVEHRFVARAEADLPLVLRLPDAGPLHEAERICVEAGVQRQEGTRVVQEAAVAHEVDQHATPRAFRRALTEVAAHYLSRRRPGATDLQARIEGDHPRVVAFQLAVGDERTDGRFFT